MSDSAPATQDAPKSATADKLRIVVVYRADLPQMTRGKGEVQFGHAVASVLVPAMKSDPDLVERYMDDNQPKINMEVADTAALLKIKERAEKRGVQHFLVTDAAHTVFDCPTVTAIGLGPMTKTDGNNVTRGAWMRDSDADFAARVRAKGAAIGLAPSAVEKFSDLDRETLAIQAALLWSVAIASQNKGLESELRPGPSLSEMLDLCRSNGIEIPDAIDDHLNPSEPGA